MINRIIDWIKKPKEMKMKSIRSKWISFYFSLFPKSSYSTKTLYGLLEFRNDYIGKAIYIGSYDEKEMSFLAKFIPENFVIADIGANIGYYTLLFLRNNKSKVYSFEPSVREFQLLKKNIQANGVSNHCVLEQLIVSNTMDDKTLHLSDLNFGTNTLYPSQDNVYSKSITVKSTTLDDYANRKNIKINFIKLDVEGAELEVLEGAINVLLESKPHIFIEVWGSHKKYFSPENDKVTLHLHNLGYLFYTINSNFKLSMVMTGDFVEEFNFLAIHNENKKIADQFI